MPFRHDTPTIPRDIPLHELTDTELDVRAHRARLRRDTAVNATNPSPQSIASAYDHLARISAEYARREHAAIVERPEFDDQGNPLPAEHEHVEQRAA